MKSYTACIHSSLNVTKATKSKRMRQETVSLYDEDFKQKFCRKPIQVGRARRRCEDIIKRRLKNTRCKGVDCIHLAENSLVPVNTATNPWTPQMAENFLSLSLSRRTPCVSRFNDRPSANDVALESQNRIPGHTNIDRAS